MNALRLVEGVGPEVFERRTGLSPEAIADTVAALREEGLMEEQRLALTEFGQRHLDTVVARFL